MVRLAQAIEKEQPYLLRGIRRISRLSLPKAESGLHQLIRNWGLALPLDLYYTSTKGSCLLPWSNLQPGWNICFVKSLESFWAVFRRNILHCQRFLNRFGTRTGLRRETILSFKGIRSIWASAYLTVYSLMKDVDCGKRLFKLWPWKHSGTLRHSKPVRRLESGATKLFGQLRNTQGVDLR